MGGEWYEAVSPGSIFESDFEQLLLAHAQDLYPGYLLVPFKKVVESEHGTAIADLALIDKGFREWWVVEVELGVHPFRGHVERQISVLSTASYGADEAAYLIQRNPDLDDRAVRAMMLGLPPRTLVVVNESKPDWVGPLRRWDAVVGVVEVFRSQRNQEILRVNGSHPEPMGNLVSICDVDPGLPNSLVVASPGGLDAPAGSLVSVECGDGISQWRRMDVADRVWLMPTGRYPLSPQVRSFRLVRATGGGLVLEALPKSARQRR